MRVLIFVVCSIIGSGCRRPTVSPPPAPPPTVYVASPSEQSLADVELFTGRTEAYRSVDVRSRVTGYLDTVSFVDGSEVEKGATLFQIDPRPYQAELEEARALLAQADARVARTEADYKRLTVLLSRGTATREEFDRAAGELAEARASIGIADAQVAKAQLNVDFTRVTAPISGRISRRLVDPGNLVKADDTQLTTIVALDPMYMYFDIDERTLLRIRRLIREGRLASAEGAGVPIQAALADETGFTHEGMLDFSENRVDSNSGTLRIRGIISNPRSAADETTRDFSPGMFVRVRLPIGEPRPVVVVPEQAVGSDQGRRFVYVIVTGEGKDGKPVERVEYRPIEVGRLVEGGARIVENGLEKEDRVVVRGLQRIKPGAIVLPVPDPEFSGTKSAAVGPADQSVSPTSGGDERSGTTAPAPRRRHPITGFSF
ncbi:MAG: efflux RND transporter periplasmic adaptor subunit [Isosphaeraceae bacterium]|nr:efflux RND transporter periplasmic adaptor subunit [Isosphaeraceae bacterium]